MEKRAPKWDRIRCAVLMYLDVRNLVLKLSHFFLQSLYRLQHILHLVRPHQKSTSVCGHGRTSRSFRGGNITDAFLELGQCFLAPTMLARVVLVLRVLVEAPNAMPMTR